jgi:hypothetical protein
MRVTVHQPTYLPYLGFFAKFAAADRFIFYDTAQWEKGSVHNRQRIRTSGGSQWLTIPMSRSLEPYTSAKISYNNPQHPWYEIHWRALEQHYRKARHFECHQDPLRRMYLEGHPFTLGKFNMQFITYILQMTGLVRPVHDFSQLGVDPLLSPSEKLAVAVEKVGGTEYISGPSGKKYLDMKPFGRRKITVSFFEFHHPTYPQYHEKYGGQFLPNMTSLDALFNIGYLPIDLRPNPGNSVSRAPLRHHPSRDKAEA